MTEQNWFNLNISGLGYLNRIRDVKPKKGQAFLCCDISALRGPSDDVEYQRFDCRVTGREAQQLIRRCIPACQQNRKVLIQFRLGDLYADTFVYTHGKRQGQTGISLKAHLLFIGMIKVDGKLVYQAKQHAAEAEGNSVQDAGNPHADGALPTVTEACSNVEGVPPSGAPLTPADTRKAEDNDEASLPAEASTSLPAESDKELAYF